MSTDKQEAVIDYLTADTTLSSYIGDRCYYGPSDMSSEYPRIVFNIPSGPDQSESTDLWQRWRFFFVAENQSTIEAMRKRVKELLNRAYGSISSESFYNISFIDDLPIVLRDDQNMEAISDYRFSYDGGI
ncbi:MAG: hypothetical protein JSW06_02760 [Thermoplasmatales archaeon]|nr:MAG: hypothetical protein JSW06_02760 [Thermoplasmatales archaeon]